MSVGNKLGNTLVTIKDLMKIEPIMVLDKAVTNLDEEEKRKEFRNKLLRMQAEAESQNTNAFIPVAEVLKYL